MIMQRERQIELLDLLKNRQISHEQFLQELKNDGKATFRLVLKNADGNYTVNGKPYSEAQLKELRQKFPPSRVINVTSRKNEQGN